MKNIVLAGASASLIGLVAGSLLGTFGAWGLALDQSPTPAGRWIIALTLGVVLAAVYVYAGFSKFLPGTAVDKGVVFGLLLWVVTLVVGAIVSGVGNYAFADPASRTVFLSLVLFVIWGGFLGFLYQES
ncbi:MAG TPA: hypothetical protein VIK81_02180 [Patescibacteria group bacterium]